MDKTKKQKSEEEKFKENRNKWISLSGIIKFLEKKGLEINDCQYLDGRTDYVRGKKLEECLKNNLEEVCKQINQIMETKISPKNQELAVQEIYAIFKSFNIIKKASREEGDKRKHIKMLLPYEMLAIQYGCNCGKDHEKEGINHIKKLDLDEINRFDPSFCYVLNIHRGKSMIYVYLSLIIAVILIYALEPIWPHSIRVIIWWVCYILSLTILGLYLIRLMIYIFFYTFGYDVWIFPDLDDPKLGFFESFYRVISAEKRKDKWIYILIRIILAIITGYTAFYVYKNPGCIEEAKKLLFDALKDYYSFGEDKFVNARNSTAIRARQKNTISLSELDDL